MKRVIEFLGALAATIVLFWLLSVSWGPAPPLGSFLSPSSGFWSNAQTSSHQNKSINLSDSLLSDSVDVYFDKHRIPHIFAQNEHDLYFAQGYITARDRLWQMEFQTRAAAGRLSEVLGPRTLSYDRYQRRIGMGYAAEQTLAKMMDDSETAAALNAYAAGVNLWIAQLASADYPLEYKIFDYRPEHWTPLKSALLLKYMTYTLTGYTNNDLRMSNTKAYFGKSFINNVLDLKPSLTDPVIPSSKKWGFKSHNISGPDSSFTPYIVKDVMPFQPDATNGSNNWAVSGRKTASGYPILANDPHLNLTLPSIWYAAQLHSPKQNVMGVSLPGAPTIIIGFNEDVAWGTTNVGADVWDWYQIQFRDSALSEYKYNGRWRPTHQRIEKIKVKDQKTRVDTVIYTRYGPVSENPHGKDLRKDIPQGDAMRWIAYKKSNEFKYFFRINKAKSYDDYRAALHYYESPAQNWVFADSSNIALTVAGKFPLKWDQQGRYISDGSNPAYNWHGWIPFEEIPFVKNPPRSFVSSANQDPTDDSYPYYLNDDFAPFDRGRRINDQLTAMNNITPKDMQQLQLDTYSYHAKTALPILFHHLDTDTLSDMAQKAYQKLENWNFHNNAQLIAPSISHYWWDAFNGALWGDEYGSTDIPLKWPARDETVQYVTHHPQSRWYDNINTPKKETLEDLVNQSFAKAINQLENKFSSFGNAWKWGKVKETKIGHLGRIPGFGRTDLETDGARESINAISGNHGPSWRMVVQLGPKVKAWGIYPGGQSGNPGSAFYDDMLDDWANGKLYPLWFMCDEPTSRDSLAYVMRLK